VRLTNSKIEFLFADSIAELDIDAIKKSEPLGVSPVDGTPVFETPAAYMSASTLDGDKKNGLQISKIILAREIKPDHIRQLLTDGKTELITHFISKKKRPFDAYLLMGKTGKITFEFPPRKRKGKQSNE
jgi:DNA topoisomerase-3